MARTALALQTMASFRALPLTPLSADATMLTSDATNFNTFPNGLPLFVLVQNTDATGHHVTFHSAPSGELNRTGDITSYALAAGDIALFGPFDPKFWSNSGFLNVDTDNTLVKLCAFALPQIY